MLYEIRSYQFEPTLFDEFKTWARTSALPWLSTKIDLVGFCTNLAEPMWIDTEWTDGSAAANIRSIIRWPDKTTRDLELRKVFDSGEWAEMFTELPGRSESYLRMEGKFAERLA